MSNFEVIALDTSVPQLRAPGAGNGYAFTSGTNTLGVWTTDGLGIGTSSPGAKLEVNAGANTDIRVNTSGSGYLQLGQFTNGAFIGTSSSSSTAGVLRFGTAGTAQVWLDTSGNLGLGTSSPAAKLDVRGAIWANYSSNGTAFFTSNGTSSDLTISTATNETRLFNAGGAASLVFGTNSTERMRLDPSGNLGIGTSSPGYKLEVNGSAAGVKNSNGNAVEFHVNNTNASARDWVLLSTGSSWAGGGQTGYFNIYDNTAGQQRLTIDTSGNLGLGVTPSAWGGAFRAIELPNVSFVGAAGPYFISYANCYYNNSSQFIYKTSSYATNYQQALGQHQWFTAPSGTAGDPISFTQAMTLDSSGNLGVGTTSPGYPLEVRKDQNAGTKLGVQNQNSGAAALAGIDFQAYGGGWQIEVPASTTFVNPLRFSFNGSERVRIDSSGNLLIGTTTAGGLGATISNSTSSPTYAVCGSASTGANYGFTLYSSGASANRFLVDYAGNIFATNPTISAISDRRLKENVRDLDVGLDAILALKPRKFDWKAGKGKDIKNDRGFIAQEFEQVFPDLVDDWADPAPEGEEPYKSVRQDLIPVLVKAIQELTARVAQLESR